MRRATEPDVQATWKRYLAKRGRRHKDQLIVHYVPLVRNVAERLAARLPRSVETGDLLGAGVFGLLKAIENFDPGRNARFETYGRLRVKGAMIDYLRQQDWIPREARNRGSRLQQAIQGMEAKLGRAPTDLELSRRLKMSLRAVRSVLAESNFSSMVSLTGDGPGNGSLDERVQGLMAEDAEPADILHRREMYQAVARDLTAIERRLVQAYYFDGLTLKEIGRREGISESRVCQIHGRMLDRMAERLEDAS